MDYFERPELPGQKFFQCEPLRGSLSVTACAGMWAKANGAKPDNVSKCCGCPVGAAHAGSKIVTTAIQRRKVCCRCLRVSGRLIRGVICVSCFNRELEVINGKNAKGLPPVKHPPVGAYRLRYRVDGVPRDRRFDRVVNASEAIIAMVHKHGSEVQFGFSGSYRVTWGAA